MDSQLVIGVPTQLQMSQKNDLSCWVSTRPDSDRNCTFDEETYTFTIPEINPYMVRGGNAIEVELKGFINSEFAATTDTFSILTKTAEGYLIDEWTENQGINSACNYPCL